MRRRREEQVGPSSRASREAAASNCTSDGSHPPLGTTEQTGGKYELATEADGLGATEDTSAVKL